MVQEAFLEIESNTIILGNFTTPLSTMDGSSRHKINKETVDFNNTIDQVDKTDIYVISHPVIREYTHILQWTQRTFSQIYHMLVTKQVLTDLRRLKSNPVSFTITPV